MATVISDPWAVDDSGAVTRRRRAFGSVGLAAAAVVVGAVGPVVEVWGHGGAGERASLVLVALAVGVVVAAQLVQRGALVAGAVAAGCAVAGGGALSVGLVGRAPALVTAAGVALAHGALFGVPVVAGRPRRQQAPPPAGAAVAVVALGQALWVQGGSNLVMTGVLVVAAVLLLLHVRGVAALLAAERGLHRGVTALASVIGTAALFVVALPTLYLPGFLVELADRLVGSRRPWNAPSSNWRRRPALDDAGRSREARHPASAAPPAVRWRRNAVGAAVLASIVVGAWLGTRPEPVGDRPVARNDVASPVPDTSNGIMDALSAMEATPFSERAAYEGVPFADELQAELGLVEFIPDPVGGYRLGDLSSRYTNWVDGERRSLAATCDCPRVRLWMAGGSAAFGLGQRDEFTIASGLVRLAEADGVGVEVHNLGVPGWSLWQEYQGILARLAFTEEPPDVVVFLDGYNDTVGTVVGSTLDDPPDVPTVMDPDDVATFMSVFPHSDRPLDGVALGRLAATRYEAIRSLIAGQLEAMGIEVQFFFQPDALASPEQRAPVDELYGSIPAIHQFSDLDAALEVASTELAPKVHNLRHVLDGHGRPVFADTVHTNEEGAAVVARAMYERVSERLQARAR